MDLARLLAPRDPELARRARALHARRVDLRTLFPDPDGAGFRQWLGTNGLLEDESIARFYPPVPMAEMRLAGCGGPTIHSHLYTGAEDFRVVAELFEIFAARPIESVESALDFGCGCGRLLRWLGTALPDARLVGADVRASSIAWCRAHLAGEFLVNRTVPPLELPDASVDLVVALSVFSHLTLESNLAWMEELVRVCKRDGLILVSTHGAFALALCARSPEHQAGLCLTAEDARDALRVLAREHFVHRRVPSEVVAAGEGVEEHYGQAFFGELFAHERWGAFAEVLGCVPVAQNLFQDMHALRPR